MFLITVLWTLVCAIIILGYSIHLYRKSSSWIKKVDEPSILKAINTVELCSIDLKNQLPSWSISLDIPQITEEVLYGNPILFYLETEAKCLKLPYTNHTLGYIANVYKNTGKVYITFKSLSDTISNFHIPLWHLNQLKVLIIKSGDQGVFGYWDTKLAILKIGAALMKKNININDYEETLGYLSNIATIDFKGHQYCPGQTQKTQKAKRNPKKKSSSNLVAKDQALNQSPQ